jgi:uncharacterized integral membrane protein (TIGR00698 family)
MTPLVSAEEALLLGIAIALSLGNPWPASVRELGRRTLVFSVMGLGAGMDLRIVGRVGLHGLGYTAVGIACAFALGTALGRNLKVPKDTALLVTVGTAICGGSAIAAVAPSIRAKEDEVSMALVTIFLLNAAALFLFPLVGHRLHLSQEAFGLWCALAIHDTSSVVAAAASYGRTALEVATAAKLARALWIVPVTFVLAALRDRGRSAGGEAGPRIRPPWFIAGFVGAAALVTAVPALAGAGRAVASAAHRLLIVTLFLVGLGMSRSALRSVGPRPLVQALALWAVLGGLSLLAVSRGWVQ